MEPTSLLETLDRDVIWRQKLPRNSIMVCRSMVSANYMMFHVLLLLSPYHFLTLASFLSQSFLLEYCSTNWLR